MATSAGILAYRKKNGNIEVLLCHPGGPYFRNKDLGSWTLPKGLPDKGEDLLDAAKREFEEEIGTALPEGLDYTNLETTKMKSGKVIHAWGVLLEIEITKVSSNTFTVEWPPRSGNYKEFPEVDRVEWFSIEDAKEKMHPAQVVFVERLAALLLP